MEKSKINPNRYVAFQSDDEEDEGAEAARDEDSDDGAVDMNHFGEEEDPLQGESDPWPQRRHYRHVQKSNVGMQSFHTSDGGLFESNKK